MTTDIDTVDQALIDALAPEARYVMWCPECRKVWTRERDCPATQYTRNGDRVCAKCKTTIEMVRDPKAENNGKED